MTWAKLACSAGNQFCDCKTKVDSILIERGPWAGPRPPDYFRGPSEGIHRQVFQDRTKIIPKLIQDIDYTLDEKHRTATLTEERRRSKCERLLGLGNLYDPAHMEQIHHVYQALRAPHAVHSAADVGINVVKDGEK